MSLVPVQRRPIDSGRFVGRVPTDPIAALAGRMRQACASAVDTDEVAAILEASGINDRIAADDYGVPSVFALANKLVEHKFPDAPALQERRFDDGEPSARSVVVDTMVRSVLYLTPLAMGFGAVSEVDGLPAVVTVGTLVVGWGGGQALAYLGYRALAHRGREGAARLLGAGFLGLGAVWCAVLAIAGAASARAIVVAVAQIALFSVGTVTLVTSRARAVLAATVPCWFSTGAVALGLGGRAVAALLVSLALLTGVAFWPAFWPASDKARPSMRRWRAWRTEVGRSLLYGAVGAGQAALLIIVAFDDTTTAHVPPALVPMLVGAPLIELTLVWHQRRIAASRRVLSDRGAFEQRLVRLSAGTLAALAAPIAGGAVIAAAVWSGALPPGAQPVGAAVLLTSVFALCLVLTAHRRAGTAATLVWWPTLLVAGVGYWAPALVHVVPQFTETLAAATLLGAALPGLVVAAFVLRDPESYR
jgi:hypothetical protein